MTDLPRIRRREASEQLRSRDFVLRRGSRGPMLTIQDTHGRAVHVPLRDTMDAHGLQIAPPSRAIASRLPALVSLSQRSPMSPTQLSDELTSTFSDRTPDLASRLTRGDYHFRSLDEAFSALALLAELKFTPAHREAIESAAARFIARYAEGFTMDDLRARAMAVGEHAEQLLLRLQAPRWTSTIIDQPSGWLWSLTPHGDDSFVGLRDGVLHLYEKARDHSWSWSTIHSGHTYSRAMRGCGGIVAVDLERSALDLWRQDKGTWICSTIEHILPTWGTQHIVALSDRVVLIPPSAREGTGIQRVRQGEGWHSERAPHFGGVDAICPLDDDSFVASGEAGIVHYTRAQNEWRGHVLQPFSGARARNLGAFADGGFFHQTLSDELSVWMRCDGEWQREVVPLHDPIARSSVWSHGDKLVAAPYSGDCVQVLRRIDGIWIGRATDDIARHVTGVLSVGNGFVSVNGSNNAVSFWSEHDPELPLERPVCERLDIALTQGRLALAERYLRDGQQPNILHFLDASQDAEAPLAILARSQDVRTPAGQTLFGYVLEHGSADVAHELLMSNAKCDAADIERALNRAPAGIIVTLLGRGLLQAYDPRLVALDAAVASKLVLACVIADFLPVALRLLQRYFPAFPAEVEASQFAAAKQLIEALEKDAVQVGYALLSAPETLRAHLCQTTLREKLPRMMVKLAARKDSAHLARTLFALPGMNFNGLAWQKLSRNADIRKTLAACGAPKSVIARLQAARPRDDWSIAVPAPRTTSLLATWITHVVPRIKSPIMLAAHRQSLDQRSEAYMQKLIRTLVFWDPKVWTAKLHIHFAGERGVDQGGLTAEWLHTMAEVLFDPALGAFVKAGNEVQVTLAAARPDKAWRDHVLVAGRIVGRCLHNGTPTGIQLPPAYLAMLTGRTPTVDMVIENQPHMAWLRDLLANRIEGESGLTFQLPDGALLLPHGDSVAVTESNKHMFVRLVCDYLPDDGLFLQGIFDVVPPSVLAHLEPEALGRIIAGETSIDVEAWVANIELDGDVSRHEREPAWFKQLLREYAQTRPEALKKVLELTTNLKSAPAGGFAHMEPKFSLRTANFEGLPVAHTCDRSIDLPHCKDFEDLRAKMEHFLAQDKRYGFA